MISLDELKQILEEPKKIVILSHRNPDGDAIGSSLALYHFLKKLGHQPNVAFPSTFPDIFNWMEDSDKIHIHDLKPKDTDELVASAEMIFCLDFNTLQRIDKLGEAAAKSEAPKVLIDHHLDPDDFPFFALHDPSASSTCELIFDFICLLDKKSMIDNTIGECIFTGILTDTGSFQYSTSAKLYHIVGELKEMGVDDNKLQNLTFNSLTTKQLRLLGHCLTEGLEILDEYSTGIIKLTIDDYKKFNIQRGDTEGIVNYVLRIKKMKVAAFIMERDGIIKLSLRSKGNFSVQQIASQYFNGGGHRNASGGHSKLNLEDTIQKFIGILPEYKQELCN